MANVRAIMKGDYDFEDFVGDTTKFYWLINFNCRILDGSGYFTAETKTLVNIGDSAAVSQAKIIDTIVAMVAARGDGHSLPRTNVYLLPFTRGS